ncbi:MAG: FAD:protein FMN transferase [Planctomycetota bacterium]
MPEEPDSNRRDFFKGTPAIRKFREAVGKAQDTLSQGLENRSPEPASNSGSQPDPISSTRKSAYLETYTANAMACQFELLFNLHQYTRSGTAAMLAIELLEELEDRMSIYREHSEFSRANLEAFSASYLMEPGVYEMLKMAKELFYQTKGAFDISSGPLSALWGFDHRQGQLPETSEIEKAMMNVGSELFELNDEKCSIRFSVPGIRLNPGGIGKGFALDKMVDQIRAKDINDFVIHGGQSSVIAAGSSDPDDASAGWTIGLTHPTIPGVRLGEFVLRNKALGTSGTARQAFFHQGRRYGHVIDPRTGWPTDHTLSSTVVTDSAAVSDALATAFFVMTHEEVSEFCNANPDVTAILVVPQSDSGQVLLQKFNVDENDWKPAQ